MSRRGSDRNGAPRVDREFIDSIAGPFRAVRRYCRVAVEGLENLPEGKAVLAANHTGWLGLDHANLFLTLYDKVGRVPLTAVHPSFFRLPLVRDAAERVGLFEVSVGASVRLLDRGELVLFFPEGEDGNFKPLWERYRLQGFKPGFARVALAAGAPIVPVVIVGGEDANPSLGRASALESALGLPVPVPVNVVPFPVKWRIRFMEPIPVDKWLEGDVVDLELGEQIAGEVRRRMQEEVARQLAKRGNPIV